MVRVLFVGQIPPPHLGAHIMLGYLVRGPLEGIDLRHIPLKLSSNDSEVGQFSLMKLLCLFALVVRILFARVVQRSQILYYSPELVTPRNTVMRDAAILSLTRWAFPKTVLHCHASGYRKLYDQLPRLHRWLLRRGFFYPDGLIRISRLTPNDGRQLKALKEYIVPNGIEDLGRRIPLPRAPRQITIDEPLRVLFVALLSEPKGLWTLIDACGILIQRGVPVRLNVMGSFINDEFESRTRAKVSDLNLDGHVRFLGKMIGDDKIAAFSEADVLCHPTYFDTFPIVLLEAMAAGLPVVSTFHSGIPSIVDDGDTGFLVEPRDATAVADRLACLADDAALRVQMGLAGREKFVSEFALDKHLQRMRRVFFDVAGVPIDKDSEQERSGSDDAQSRKVDRPKHNMIEVAT